MVGIERVASSFVYIEIVVAVELDDILDAVLICELEFWLYYRRTDLRLLPSLNGIKDGSYVVLGDLALLTMVHKREKQSRPQYTCQQICAMDWQVVHTIYFHGHLLIQATLSPVRMPGLTSGWR